MNWPASAVMQAAALPPALAAAGVGIFRLCLRGLSYPFYRGWAFSAGCMAGAEAAQHQRAAAAVSAANVLLAAFLWWLSRRRRKRAPRSFGAKSRALLAAVVRTMRERSRPRPVLRPVPGRAGLEMAATRRQGAPDACS